MGRTSRRAPTRQEAKAAYNKSEAPLRIAVEKDERTAADTALANSTNTQAGQISNLTNQNIAQANRLAALEATTVTQAGQIGNLNNANTNLANRLAALEATTAAQATQISNLNAANDAKTLRLNDMDTTNANQNGRLNDLEAFRNRPAGFAGSSHTH